VPTSVLLAVLAAAGLLALAPALTRRYDATERVAAERATSAARVLTRRRRRRTVPGPRPVNPPRFFAVLRGGRLLVPISVETGSAASRGDHEPKVMIGSRSRPQPHDRRAASRAASSRRAGSSGSRRRSSPARRPATALHRRRRVFLALLLLNVVELAGVLLVGPGFWIGFSVSFVVLLADLVYLRRRALAASKARRRVNARRAWVASQQAAVRRQHARRSAERQAAAKRAAASRERARRDAVRRSAEYMERYS
jgi:hypothetical protein